MKIIRNRGDSDFSRCIAIKLTSHRINSFSRNTDVYKSKRRSIGRGVMNMVLYDLELPTGYFVIHPPRGLIII